MIIKRGDHAFFYFSIQTKSFEVLIMGDKLHLKKSWQGLILVFQFVVLNKTFLLFHINRIKTNNLL